MVLILACEEENDPDVLVALQWGVVFLCVKVGDEQEVQECVIGVVVVGERGRVLQGESRLATFSKYPAECLSQDVELLGVLG